MDPLVNIYFVGFVMLCIGLLVGIPLGVWLRDSFYRAEQAKQQIFLERMQAALKGQQ